MPRVPRYPIYKHVHVTRLLLPLPTTEGHGVIANREKGLSRFDSTSCFGTGPTKDHQVKKTEVHADKKNASAEGDNRCPTYTRLSMVLYDCVPHYVRLGFNTHMKQCCSDFMHRLEMNNDLTAAIRDCPTRDRRGNTRRLYAKFIPPPEVPPPEQGTSVWTYPASHCRDPYESFFTNVINEHVGLDGQRDRGTLLECLYTLPFTPSQEGWLETFQATCSKMQPGENFLLAYVHNAVQDQGQ